MRVDDASPELLSLFLWEILNTSYTHFTSHGHLGRPQIDRDRLKDYFVFEIVCTFLLVASASLSLGDSDATSLAISLLFCL